MLLKLAIMLTPYTPIYIQFAISVNFNCFHFVSSPLSHMARLSKAPQRVVANCFLSLLVCLNIIFCYSVRFTSRQATIMSPHFYTKALIFIRKYLVLFKLRYTKISVLISVKETSHYIVIF